MGGRLHCERKKEFRGRFTEIRSKLQRKPQIPQCWTDCTIFTNMRIQSIALKGKVYAWRKVTSRIF